MAIRKATGIIIRAHDFRESSRIVTLLSPEVGKFSLLAKGARRPESPLGAALDLLNRVEVVFYEGRSRGLRLLKEAALIASYPKLKRDYDRLEVALQGARALNLLLREGQRDRRIYQLFEELLEELDVGANVNVNVSPSYLALGFKLKLIDLLGFGPILDRCSLCREPLEAVEAEAEAKAEAEVEEPGLWFSPEAGGTVCGPCHRGAADPALAGQAVEWRLVKALRMILRLPLRRLSRLVLPEELIAQGEELLDRFIAYHLQPI